MALNLKRVKELENELSEARGKKREHETGADPEENRPEVFKQGSAPGGHTPKAVTTWITSLKLDKEAKKKLTEDIEKMSKINVEDLQSKLLSMGLPMKIVSAMKKSELGRVVAAGFAISASKS